MHPKHTDAGTVVRNVGDEILLFQHTKSLLHHLNATAACLWKMCDGEHSSEEMVDTLTRRFDAPRNVLEQDVVATLEELALRGLITK